MNSGCQPSSQVAGLQTFEANQSYNGLFDSCTFCNYCPTYSMQFQTCFPTDWHSLMVMRCCCVDGLRELLVWELLGRRAEIWPSITRSNSFQAQLCTLHSSFLILLPGEGCVAGFASVSLTSTPLLKEFCQLVVWIVL